MAESIENAIPNKKNQKNAVIVPIHVHSHDSQVSQIFYRDIASDVTQEQQKNIEVVHHQDVEILQADDNLNKSLEFVRLPCPDIKATLVHHQEDEILLAGDNLNSSYEFVRFLCQNINTTRRKTPAERMRQ
ncbi:hypothetical protein TNCV_1189761 [Trichonephila clavipes]|nr:hypothetical protein TNCV_1189761 [Trichonephila clavipes]